MSSRSCQRSALLGVILGDGSHLPLFCFQYSYLLTSQLESQRIYWENKIVRIEKDTAEEVNDLETEMP